jgi:hypothetical protein
MPGPLRGRIRPVRGTAALPRLRPSTDRYRSKGHYSRTGSLRPRSALPVGGRGAGRAARARDARPPQPAPSPGRAATPGARGSPVARGLPTTHPRAPSEGRGAPASLRRPRRDRADGSRPGPPKHRVRAASIREEQRRPPGFRSGRPDVGRSAALESSGPRSCVPGIEPVVGGGPANALGSRDAGGGEPSGLSTPCYYFSPGSNGVYVPSGAGRATLLTEVDEDWDLTIG